MSLPQISIPAVNLPIEIPTLLHPVVDHFAIAIPVLLVVLEILNLFFKSKSLKITTAILWFVMIGIFFVAYLTGVHDAKVALDNDFSAVSELKEHKLLGMYIVYASVGVLILKLLSLLINRTGFRVFYILVLFGFLASVLHQGKEGGELVYKHSANVMPQKDEFDDDDEDEDKTSTKVTDTKPTPVADKNETKTEEKATTEETKVEKPKTEAKPVEEEKTVDKNKTTEEKIKTILETNSSKSE